MSFFSSMRRALGFGGDDDDDIDYSIVSTDDDEAAPHDGACPAGGESARIPDSIQFEPAMQELLLDGMLAVFNESLPAFVGESIDGERQRQALARRLDQSVADYLKELEAQALKFAEQRLKASADAAVGESDRLRKEMERVEQQKNTLREQQLSADRRRRALSDRVNDLEAQVARLESEREQFELENRSLLNKVKLADVQPGIIDELKAEIERLKGAPADGAEELERLAAECAQGATRVAELEQAQEMAKQMYSQLQEELTGERERRRKAETDLAESLQIVNSVQEVQKAMEQVQSVIAKRDERIARLKTSNKKLKDSLSAAMKELDDLRHNDSGSLFAIGKEEMDSAEEDFETPGWFACEPSPELTPRRPENPDFGYVEPPRRPRQPDSDAQTTLF